MECEKNQLGVVTLELGVKIITEITFVLNFPPLVASMLAVLECMAA